MKSRIYKTSKLIFLFLFITAVNAEDVAIESKNMSFDKPNQKTIFSNEVILKTKENKSIKSEYAEYDKKNGLIILKDEVVLIDRQNNKIETNHAEYFEDKKIFKTIGASKIITKEGYVVDGSNFFFDSLNNNLVSKESTVIKDVEENTIYLENFEFLNRENIFKSVGSIKVEDKIKNVYEFSQIYIDVKKKEILGTDIKAFVNDEKFKVNPKNKPRIFANSVNINEQKSVYNKSIFTLCNYRKNDKCPPWSIQSSKMLHDNKKKTIYYDNALVKIYDIPIFYIPKLSHPDPTVDRRSGFLPPTISDTKNLGASVTIPYFFAINNDKNFTLNSRIFNSENPLFVGEYHQAFKNSNFYADFGYTEGYKKTSETKKAGDKSHFFSKFIKSFKGKNNSDNTLNITLQDVSDDKYLKLYKINTNLVDYNADALENTIDFAHSDDDMFLGINATAFKTLKDSYNDKYEYILPEAFLEKNLFNNDFGNLDLQTNMKIHNYDTNKTTKFFVNDLIWNSKDILFNSGLSSKILGNIKNINYETRNVDVFKESHTNEAHGAIGLLSELKLQKNTNNSRHLLTPKLLFRYAPGQMRQEENGSKLDPTSAFSMNKANNVNNFEKGLSTSIGIDYKIKNKKTDFDFSVAQVINDMENKKMSSESSLDEKLSDLVGSTNLKIGKRLKLNYDFALDQNYRELNYNDLGLSLDYNKINFNLNYLQEDKHIGNQEYLKTKINLSASNNGLVSFETKRNLIKNSSEFYNLSYEYINDCLRAGLVYRREFYNDSELEPENSLMFKITLTPFGSIDSPTFSK